MLYDRRECTNFVDDETDESTKKWSREYAKELERRKSVVYEKRIDPKHPYCTNWPVPKNLTNEEE